jgi:hypothetical protein
MQLRHSANAFFQMLMLLGYCFLDHGDFSDDRFWLRRAILFNFIGYLFLQPEYFRGTTSNDEEKAFYFTCSAIGVFIVLFAYAMLWIELGVDNILFNYTFQMDLPWLSRYFCRWILFSGVWNYATRNKLEVRGA